jgi:hypothetical protein
LSSLEKQPRRALTLFRKKPDIKGSIAQIKAQVEETTSD